MVNPARPMNNSFHAVTRRRFLRATGVSLALPFLDAGSVRGGAAPDVKRRMVAINLGLGFLPENFTPAKAGRDYALTKYLQVVKDFRDQFTVISGTSSQ